MSENSNSKNLKYEDQLILELRKYSKLIEIKKHNEKLLKISKKQIGMWLKMHSLDKYLVNIDENTVGNLKWSTRKSTVCDWDLLLEQTSMQLVDKVKKHNESDPFVVIRISHKKNSKSNKNIKDLLDVI